MGHVTTVGSAPLCFPGGGRAASDVNSDECPLSPWVKAWMWVGPPVPQQQTNYIYCAAVILDSTKQSGLRS